MSRGGLCHLSSGPPSRRPGDVGGGPLLARAGRAAESHGRGDGLSARDGTRATAVAGALGGRGLPLVRVACPQTGGEGIRVSYWNPASAGVSLFAKNGLGSFCLPADWGWDV